MNYIYRILGILFIVSASGCSGFLDEVPRSIASPENLYVDEKGAEAAVIGAYGGLQRMGVYGERQYFLVTDIVRCAVWDTWGGIGTFTFSSENSEVILPYWRDHYISINEANAAITQIPGIDMDEDRKNTLIAEARFLRALLYFNLVRYFGDVPYKETEVASLNSLTAKRDPVSFVYEKIIEDCEFSIQNLAVKGEVEAGRATVDAAKTLLAKVYLTRASMGQRDGTPIGGEINDDFRLAAQYAKEVMDDGRYRLVRYYPDIFIPENKNNDEIIFDVQFMAGGVGEGNIIGMHLGLMGPPQFGGSWGNLNATQYYSTIFDSSDVVRRQWNTPFVRVTGDGELTDYTEDPTQQWRRYKIGKWRRFPVRNPNFNFLDHDINWPVFRYGEVLLIYAEALNELNGGPTAEVFTVLNQLRARVRNIDGDGSKEYLNQNILPRDLTYDPTILPDISGADYPDYSSMKEYIEFERARELGGEAKRWFDLVRWGKLVERITFLETYIPPGRSEPEFDNWDITAGNVREFHQLLPIPAQEFQVNTEMTQNPGY